MHEKWIHSLPSSPVRTLPRLLFSLPLPPHHHLSPSPLLFGVTSSFNIPSSCAWIYAYVKFLGHIFFPSLLFLFVFFHYLLVHGFATPSHQRPNRTYHCTRLHNTILPVSCVSTIIHPFMIRTQTWRCHFRSPQDMTIRRKLVDLFISLHSTTLLLISGLNSRWFKRY